MLVPTSLQALRPGDVCVVDDGHYSHCAGQRVIVCDRSPASELQRPDGEARWPVLIPESGRLMLLPATTPVLVED